MNTKLPSLLLSLPLLLACQREKGPGGPLPLPSHPPPAAQALAQPAAAPAPSGQGLSALPAPQPSFPTAAGQALDARALLNVTDGKTLGMKGGIAADSLAGVPRSGAYDSARLHLSDPGSDYGVAVQWWRAGSLAEAEARYEKDLASYPDAKAKDEVGDKSFRGYRGGIMYVHFLDRAKRSVVSLTCSDAICSPGSRQGMPKGSDPFLGRIDALKFDSLAKLAGQVRARVPAAPVAGTP